MQLKKKSQSVKKIHGNSNNKCLAIVSFYLLPQPVSLVSVLYFIVYDSKAMKNHPKKLFQADIGLPWKNITFVVFSWTYF